MSTLPTEPVYETVCERKITGYKTTDFTEEEYNFSNEIHGYTEEEIAEFYVGYDSPLFSPEAPVNSLIRIVGTPGVRPDPVSEVPIAQGIGVFVLLFAMFMFAMKEWK